MQKCLSIMILAVTSPEMLIAEIAIGGLVVALFWRFLVWIREAPVTPDPWDAETEQKLAETETAQACHRCSAPQAPNAWFCPHCGSAVGQYNNLMPYVVIFSEGEGLRNATQLRSRNRPLIVIGTFLVLLGMFPPVALIYAIRQATGATKTKEAQTD